MRIVFEEFGTAIVAGFICILMIIMGINAYIDVATESQDSVSPDRIEMNTARTEEEIKEQENIINAVKKPTITAKSANIDKNSLFNFYDYVKAYSPSGEDISSHVQIVNITPSTGNKSLIAGEYELDTSVAGVYTLKYMIVYDDLAAFAEATYIVD